jgi:peptidoglycan/LPS O-acetylase OafA/YrhL
MNTKGGISHKFHGLDPPACVRDHFCFLYHYGRLFPHPDWVNMISEFGWSGVDLFFVLSGYLIASQLFKNIGQQKNIPVQEFFVKRFFRIIPIYLLQLPYIFYFLLLGKENRCRRSWKYLTFTQNIGLDISKHGTFSHAWSLCIEEQFYLLLPFILIVLIRLNIPQKGYWILIALFISGFIIRAVFYLNFAADINWLYWYKWIYYPTWGRLDGLLVGVGIAVLLQFKPAFAKKILAHENILLFAGLFMFVATGFYVQTRLVLMLLCLDFR